MTCNRSLDLNIQHCTQICWQDLGLKSNFPAIPGIFSNPCGTWNSFREKNRTSRTSLQKKTENSLDHQYVQIWRDWSIHFLDENVHHSVTTQSSKPTWPHHRKSHTTRRIAKQNTAVFNAKIIKNHHTTTTNTSTILIVQLILILHFSNIDLHVLHPGNEISINIQQKNTTKNS